MRFLFVFAVIVLLSVSHPNAAESSTIPPAVRILFIGDSLTTGAYASHEQATFVSIVGENTGYQIARRHVATIQDAENEWEKIKGWSPSIVILEIGLNDVSRSLVKDNEWEDRYYRLVSNIQGTATVYPCTMFWAGINKNHPNYARYLNYNSMIRSASVRAKVKFIDLWSVTYGCSECVSSPSDISYFSPGYRGDGFHPNDYGHKVIASEIVKALEFIYYAPIVTSGG